MKSNFPIRAAADQVDDPVCSDKSYCHPTGTNMVFFWEGPAFSICLSRRAFLLNVSHNNLIQKAALQVEKFFPVEHAKLSDE